ncbi:MAG: HAD-IC family P-type ATPase [Synergistaceae bacterium]|nr:HAD-IC family P-type ATPase [Synergistaceae bacterium]
MSDNQNFWNTQAAVLLRELKTSTEGLSSAEAQKRLAVYGANTIKNEHSTNTLSLLLSQFKSPIILILLAATGISVYMGNTVDASIILVIVLISGLLGFWQEFSAGTAMAKLLELVQIKATVLRDSKEEEISVEAIVPGDIIMLKAGDMVPGDCLICESVSMFVDEAALTGESYPVPKEPGILPVETVLSKRSNCLWMGTHVISGQGKAVVIQTGKKTQFGGISEQVKLRPPETEFERGIRQFGHFLMLITLLLVFSFLL